MPEPEFVALAKKYNLLLVPGASFGCEGYVRLAYCVSGDMIKRSMAAFAKARRGLRTRKNKQGAPLARSTL